MHHDPSFRPTVSAAPFEKASAASYYPDHPFQPVEKPCIRCQHHFATGLSHLCMRHGLRMNLVTGEPLYPDKQLTCFEARSLTGQCLPSGILFDPKPEVPTEPPSSLLPTPRS